MLIRLLEVDVYDEEEINAGEAEHYDRGMRPRGQRSALSGGIGFLSAELS